jgi:glycosyltransferase involved in cell wall biosynthesis
MKEQMVSVIVPVYKVEHYLDRCVQSIVNQTYENLEIILVDDGSPDGCPALCDAWAAKDSRIKVIHKANGGAADARNAGLLAASGSYIGFVDSDDYIATEMYEKLHEALIRNNCEIAACAAMMVWEEQGIERPFNAAADCVMDTVQAQKALLDGRMLKQTIWYLLYRKQTIEGILFPSGKSHEDVFWLYRALGSAKKICMISFVGYYYIQRNDNTTAQKYSLKRLDSLEALAERQRYFEASLPELSSKGRRHFLFYCLYNGQQVIRNLKTEEKRFAIKRIEELRLQFPLREEDYGPMRLKQRIWAMMASRAFVVTCVIRNALHIGL